MSSSALEEVRIALNVSRQQPIRRSRGVVLEVCQIVAGRTQGTLESVISVRDTLILCSSVSTAAIYDRYIAYPRQRLQRLARLGRTASFHDRKGRRGYPAAKESYVFQPYRCVLCLSSPSDGLLTHRLARPAAVQVLRGARAKADDRRRRDPWFRPGIDGLSGHADFLWTILLSLSVH